MIAQKMLLAIFLLYVISMPIQGIPMPMPDNDDNGDSDEMVVTQTGREREEIPEEQRNAFGQSNQAIDEAIGEPEPSEDGKVEDRYIGDGVGEPIEIDYPDMNGNPSPVEPDNSDVGVVDPGVITNPDTEIIEDGKGEAMKIVPFPVVTGNYGIKTDKLRPGFSSRLLVAKPRQEPGIPYESWLQSDKSLAELYDRIGFVL